MIKNFFNVAGADAVKRIAEWIRHKFYTKTQTDDLLDGKQASVTITANANTPTDNDTVIMQASGTTNTTTFVRRTLATIMGYVKNYFYNLINLPYNASYGSNRRFDSHIHGLWWAGDKRFDVTWKTYDSQTQEVVWEATDENKAQLFNESSNYGIHPVDGEYDVITIKPKEGNTKIIIGTYGHGRLLLVFYSASYPSVAPAVRIYGGRSGQKAWTTLSAPTKPSNSVFQYELTLESALYLEQIEITIQGRTNGADAGARGAHLSNIDYIGFSAGINEMSAVTKYAVAQQLYGNITAPKFIMRDGTASQVLLANGTTLSLPVPINKGGTGATTAIGAEYNILNQVADISTTLSDTRKIALCNQTKSATNGVFRWIALSNVWTWIKTHFDSSPTSGSSNGITSGGVYSALEEKVNLQPDFTASQIDYSAGNVGKWQKVLRFPEGADLVINMKKTAMGSDSTSTLWFSSSSMGDSYTSLFGNHSVRFVHDGGYVFLVLACRKSTNEPIESYTFQIAHSSVPMSDIVAVTEASPITATPKEPSIVYRAPITTGAVSFNVTSGAGSVYMSGHNDFLGNMTSEASNGVTVTMSGATEGQIYRFVFTRNITGGVTFKQSNVAYCTISGDVNAGDTITLTAVSNTADGWLYEQESAGIKSTDGSVNVEYDGGVADLSINIPPDVVRNNVWTSSLGHRVLAIGDGASANTSSNNVAIGKDADASGNFAVCVGGNSEASGNYSSSFGNNAEASAFGAVAIGSFANANQLKGEYGKHELVQFKVNDESKKVYTSSTAETISIEIPGIGTFVGIDILANSILFVLSEELEFANELLFEVDGIMKQKQSFSSSAWNYMTASSKIALGSSGLYAYEFSRGNIDYSDINSSTNAYFFATSGDSFDRISGISIGIRCVSIGSESIAIGVGATSIKDGQIVLGRFNAENGTDLMQIGNGTETNRKNILTIDSNERLNVSAYVGGTQTIDMSQQTGSLSNITKAVYRIRWNDTGTVTLTLQASGCVEGQRVTIFAETNDVSVSGKLIVTGRYMDFVFIAGDWRAPQDPWQ